MTSAERARMPLTLDVVKAAAEQHGVCTRPVLREVVDLDAGEVRIVGIRCNSTQATKCPACADRNRRSRMAQCREGWHLDHEPVAERHAPTDDQVALVTHRSDLTAGYRHAVAAGELGDADDYREGIRETDSDLRREGVRGNLPAVERPARTTPVRSTRRRQDAPNLPRRKVDRRTVGREFAGKYRPSTFVTLTLDTYGKVRPDGAPVDPDAYDYRRAARDAVHFASLVDRWWQNLRRVVGFDAQYFGTVEPQRRITPHAHFAVRGSIPHKVIRDVTAATYLQVWWPDHDEIKYSGGRLPVWDMRAKGFVDPDTGAALTTWADAVAGLDTPSHVAQFGAQVHSKGILGGSEEAGRHIGYLTKYLTKSITEVVDTDTSARLADHADRLAAELAVTPCSERCAVWLLYGVQPKGATSRTTPGHCKGKAHRRDTLGLPGRRVLVSRRWSGKTLAEHKSDRAAFVREALEASGISKPDTDQARLRWAPVQAGDPHAPSRVELLMHMIAQRLKWRAEYDEAQDVLARLRPAPADVSAVASAAA
ncbi:replication initiator [Actinosynnema sp. NPDC050436]|uniref:replication initiator n=1 Tax=Actinosynnema sp. NPDC050436 TaxID=3155659 RepID=UPI0033ED27AB